MGPPIHLVATNVDATHTLPVDGAVVFSFDRLLSPYTVTRQSLALRDAFNQAPISPIVVYDPIARTVTVSSPSPGRPWLLENQPYKIILPIPKDANDVGGLRAIDGATLDRVYVVELITTRAQQRPLDDALRADPADRSLLAKSSADAGISAPRALDYCDDVMPIMRTSCSALGTCHSAPDQSVDGGAPPMGLVLTTPAGIRNTAIGRASEQLDRGASSRSAPPGKTFGANMAIIEPGDPGSSYLIYKLLSWGEPPNASADPLHVPLASDDVSRLRNRIEGQPMPPPAVLDKSSKVQPLSYDQAEVISAWIAQGAKTDECQ